MDSSLLLDGGAYSNRDRDMFLAGIQYATVRFHLENDSGVLVKEIYNENTERIRLLCVRHNREFDITPVDENLSWLEIFKK